MKKDNDILKQVARNTGMIVPDGYFESFTTRVVSQLKEPAIELYKEATLWQRVRPWLYMAAMFVGIALMVRLFTPEKENTSIAETDVSIINENVEDDLFYSNVDEYSVYEYLALGD